MPKEDSLNSDQNFSFEKGLLHRIRESRLISSFSSFPSELFSSALLQETAYIFPGSIAGNRDQLLRTLNDHLSWSDLGNYFSSLVNELGLGKSITSTNLGSIRSISSSESEYGKVPRIKVKGKDSGSLEEKKLENDNSAITGGTSISDTVNNIREPGFNVETLFRITWSDLGNYFSSLINELGLGKNVTNSGISSYIPILPPQSGYGVELRIPEDGEDAKLLKEESGHGTRKVSDDSYQYDRILSRLNKKNKLSRLNIITDNELDELPAKYNADAITLGPNIIFANDRYNINTPRGISLLAHELTHLRQLGRLPYLLSGNYYGTVDRLRSTWEQEALDNEQFTYQLLRLSDKLYHKATIGMHDYNMMPAINPVLGLANNYGMVGSLNDIKFVKHFTGFRSIASAVKPPLSFLNKNSDQSKVLPHSLTDSNPDLLFADNVNLSQNSILNKNTPNEANNTSYPMIPLLAERNRNIESSSVVGTEATQEAWASVPSQTNSTFPSTSINLDIESIAEKVYHILQSKIKIQRARRGIG